MFLVRADDPANSAYQIYLHERAHAYVRAGKINTKDIYSRMVREIGEENVAAMIREYAKAVYGTENLADLSLGDFNEAVDYVFTEIVCDALAGMNAFRKLPEMQELGGAFLETVLGETKKSMAAGTRAPPRDEAAEYNIVVST